jgi:hypothetical protein
MARTLSRDLLWNNATNFANKGGRGADRHGSKFYPILTQNCDANFWRKLYTYAQLFYVLDVKTRSFAIDMPKLSFRVRFRAKLGRSVIKSSFYILHKRASFTLASSSLHVYMYVYFWGHNMRPVNNFAHRGAIWSQMLMLAPWVSFGP